MAKGEGAVIGGDKGVVKGGGWGGCGARDKKTPGGFLQFASAARDLPWKSTSCCANGRKSKASPKVSTASKKINIKKIKLTTKQESKSISPH